MARLRSVTVPRMETPYGALNCHPQAQRYIFVKRMQFAPAERSVPMAQKVQVLLVDDLDGGEADETVSFSLDGATYEIDLSGSNAKRLRDSLQPFVDHARK